MSSMKIPMSSPDIRADEIQAVTKVMQNPILSMGEMVSGFEAALARLTGSRHGIAVSSGTAGLHICLIAAEVSSDDLVITSPFSFVASANVILYQRGIPVFVDVDERTGNIDPEQAEQAILSLRDDRGADWLPPAFKDSTSIGDIRALLPVHVFGQPAEMQVLSRVAADYGLAVIEDACEAVGAEYNGQPAGSMGDASVFAFYPNKQLTTGEGGLVVTSNDQWEPLLRSLRNQGRDVFDAWLTHSRLGFNYRMDELSAALGLAQLARINDLLGNRAQVAELYSERLKEIPGVAVPEVVPSTTKMSWFVYVIRLDSEVERKRVMRELEAVGIPSRPYFSPIHLQPYYIERFGWREGQFPIAERLGRTSLALPFSGVMSEEQVDYVSDHLARAMQAL